jgi:hypothetical protein
MERDLAALGGHRLTIRKCDRLRLPDWALLASSEVLDKIVVRRKCE